MAEWYEKVAKKYGAQVNPDAEVRDSTLEGLERKKKLFKVRYCPCFIDNTLERVCPCRPMREQQDCHCGLFVFPQKP
jgi:ferredoxin-thioredoxin reductase catalytic subunit